MPHPTDLRRGDVLLSLAPAITYFVAGAASASLMWWFREWQWPRQRQISIDHEEEEEECEKGKEEKDRWTRYVDQWKSRIGEFPGLVGGSVAESPSPSSKRRIPWPWNRRRRSNSPSTMESSSDEKQPDDEYHNTTNDNPNASAANPPLTTSTPAAFASSPSSSPPTTTTTPPIEREKSGLCIGSIFGLDVGGTLAKLVYFEQKPQLPSKLMSHRQLHYTQAAAARAVLAARRGDERPLSQSHRILPTSLLSSSSSTTTTTTASGATLLLPPPLTSLRERGRSIGEIPMSREEDDDECNNHYGDDHHLRNHSRHRRRRHSESHAPTPFSCTTTTTSSSSSIMRHSMKSNQDLEQLYHLRQDSLPDDLHEFAATVDARQTWIHSQESMKRIVLGDLQKEENAIAADTSDKPSLDENDETTNKNRNASNGFANRSAASSSNNDKSNKNSNHKSNNNKNMKRSRSMFDLSKSRDHAEALDRFYHFARRLDSYREGVRDTKLSFYSRELGGEFHFIRFETRRMTNAMDLIRANQLHVNICEMGATGGGAHKYAPEWDRVLGIRIKKQDELESLVAGMQFVLSTVVGECYTFLPRDGKGGGAEAAARKEDTSPSNGKSSKVSSSSFSSSDDDEEEENDDEDGTGAEKRSSSNLPQPVAASATKSPDSSPRRNRRRPPNVIGDEWWWSRKVQRDAISYSNTYPYLLVTIGTGVSILRVDGPRQHERISGSTIGGGTYWGLIRLLTDVEDFEDVMKLAEQGDPSKVDMMVGDIYGKNSDALEKLGLSSNLVASSFGKLVAKEDPAAGLKQEDLARALLLMVTNNIGQVAYLNAKLHHTPRIYFVGNFLRHNKISQRRLSYAINYWSKGEMEALFLEHEGYFGALGAFLLSQGITQGEHGFFQWDPKFRTSGTRDGNDDNTNESSSIPDSSDSTSSNGLHRRSETMSSLELP